MSHIFEELAKIENSSKRAALCIITETKGSTPRKATSKMIVFEDQTIKGTVGGGQLEYQVIMQALEAIEKKESRVARLMLKKDLKMSCGGYAEIYIEPIVNKIKLFIFGAGHIGRLTAKYAHELNFNVIIIDERPEIFDEFDTQNYTIINKNHNEAFADLSIDSSSFVASITHHHGYDKQVVEYFAEQNIAYLGVIASQSKIRTIKKKIIEDGKVKSTSLEKVDWPMGIAIKCQTPEEITISIIAKLIDERGKLG